MESKNELVTLIRKFINYRNKSITSVANEIGLEPKTLSAQLKRGSVSVDTLFRLSTVLDIDLNWMMAALGYYGSTRRLNMENIPRMQPKFREKEKKAVLMNLDRIIKENPNSTAEAKKALLAAFSKNEFYLLDVLVPEEYGIFFINDNDRIKLYIDTNSQSNQYHTLSSARKPISMLINASQALEIIIEDRKDEIL